MQQRYSPLNGAIHFNHQPIRLWMVGGTQASFNAKDSANVLVYL